MSVVRCAVTQLPLNRHKHVTPRFQNCAMETSKGYVMKNQATQYAQAEPTGRSRTLVGGLQDFNQQCLRVLRCTAHAMANSPGGLRFKAGTRPWLEGLSAKQPPALQNTQARYVPVLRIGE